MRKNIEKTPLWIKYFNSNPWEKNKDHSDKRREEGPARQEDQV